MCRHLAVCGRSYFVWQNVWHVRAKYRDSYDKWRQVSNSIFAWEEGIFGCPSWVMTCYKRNMLYLVLYDGFSYNIKCCHVGWFYDSYKICKSICHSLFLVGSLHLEKSNLPCMIDVREVYACWTSVLGCEKLAMWPRWMPTSRSFSFMPCNSI